jgi:hypothetical protein
MVNIVNEHTENHLQYRDSYPHAQINIDFSPFFGPGLGHRKLGGDEVKPAIDTKRCSRYRNRQTNHEARS